MNRLPSPGSDDSVALLALANNASVKSYPHLQGYVPLIQAGYAQYIAAAGNVGAINNVALPKAIGDFLKYHYSAPSNDIEYIKTIRTIGGVKACPMCGGMTGGTVDHIMPQTDFPVFAIFGQNLVPADKCNSHRGNVLTGPNAGERILHPYFDDVLGQRLLSARFDDLGPVPRISLQLLLDPAHADYVAVQFHVEKIVKRTQIEDHIRREWNMLVAKPSRLTSSLRVDPPSREALVEILEGELETRDEHHDSLNNWRSIVVVGLLDDHVIDWLFGRMSQPGRQPNTALV